MSDRHIADATILDLYVDDERLSIPGRSEPAARRIAGRSRRLVILGSIATLVIAAIGAAALRGPVHRALELADIERSIGADLSGQFLGAARVRDVRCVRETQTAVRCVAELFDKTGAGPIMQAVTVTIDQESGEYFWQAGAAYDL